MENSKAFAIAVKDMREVFSSVSIYGPMIGVPSFFALLLPALTYYVSFFAAPALAQKLTSLAALPASITAANGLIFMGFFSVNVLGPIFLTMPILTASVIAADSFAGEKERKTAEALLSSPISVSELLLGKILASLIPTLLLTMGVFALYGGITDALAEHAFGYAVLPTPAWLMMLATSPLLAIATIGVVVFISAHVRGTKEAQQISTLLVLPVLAIPFVSILGIAPLTVTFFEQMMALLLLVDFFVLYASVRSFRKEALL